MTPRGHHSHFGSSFDRTIQGQCQSRRHFGFVHYLSVWFCPVVSGHVLNISLFSKSTRWAHRDIKSIDSDGDWWQWRILTLLMSKRHKAWHGLCRNAAQWRSSMADEHSMHEEVCVDTPDLQRYGYIPLSNLLQF